MRARRVTTLRRVSCGIKERQTHDVASRHFSFPPRASQTKEQRCLRQQTLTEGTLLKDYGQANGSLRKLCRRAATQGAYLALGPSEGFDQVTGFPYPRSNIYSNPRERDSELFFRAVPKRRFPGVLKCWVCQRHKKSLTLRASISPHGCICIPRPCGHFAWRLPRQTRAGSAKTPRLEPKPRPLATATIQVDEKMRAQLTCRGSPATRSLFT